MWLHRFLVLAGFLILLVPAATSLSSFDSGCGPGCGPVRVEIRLTLDKTKGAFDSNGKFQSDGVMEFYFDIDQEGYGYDPQKTVEVTAKVQKAPKWLKASVSPTKFTVPVLPTECPDCVKPEGGPDNLEFSYSAPFKLEITRAREPTAAELKAATRSDGAFRVSVNAESQDDIVSVAGYEFGLRGGAGYTDVKFPAAAEPVSAEALESSGHHIPGFEGLGILGALGLTALLVRRQRD